MLILSIDDWYRIAKNARWKHLDEVRHFSQAVGNFTNIKGNSYRLIVSIDYESQIVFKYVLTHPEYDQEGEDDPTIDKDTYASG